MLSFQRRESWCWSRETFPFPPFVSLSHVFPRENARVRDVPAICVFWRVSSSSEPDVSTPETREAQPAVSGFGFPQHPPPSRALPPERIVTNANSTSYAFFFPLHATARAGERVPLMGRIISIGKLNEIYVPVSVALCRWNIFKYNKTYAKTNRFTIISK